MKSRKLFALLSLSLSLTSLLLAGCSSDTAPEDKPGAKGQIDDTEGSPGEKLGQKPAAAGTQSGAAANSGK